MGRTTDYVVNRLLTVRELRNKLKDLGHSYRRRMGGIYACRYDDNQSPLVLGVAFGRAEMKTRRIGSITHIFQRGIKPDSPACGKVVRMKNSRIDSKLFSVVKKRNWLKDFWRKNRSWILKTLIKMIMSLLKRILND